MGLLGRGQLISFGEWFKHGSCWRTWGEARIVVGPHIALATFQLSEVVKVMLMPLKSTARMNRCGLSLLRELVHSYPYAQDAIQSNGRRLQQISSGLGASPHL
jgi:hypothetical protein